MIYVLFQGAEINYYTVYPIAEIYYEISTNAYQGAEIYDRGWILQSKTERNINFHDGVTNLLLPFHWREWTKIYLNELKKKFSPGCWSKLYLICSSWQILTMKISKIIILKTYYKVFIFLHMYNSPPPSSLAFLWILSKTGNKYELHLFLFHSKLFQLPDS